MQRRSPFHLSVLLMAVLTFSMPFAQHTSVQAAQTKPIVQINKGLGMGTGCLMPGISTTPASSVPRILFAQQLLGKSPEYVANYAQNAQTAPNPSSQITIRDGCLVGTGIVIGGVIVLAGLIYLVDQVLIW